MPGPALSPEAAAGMLRSIPDAVVAVDPAGLITDWEGGAARIFGWRAAEVVGRPRATLFADSRTTDLDEMLSLGGAPAIDLIASCRRRRGGEFLAAIDVRALPSGGTLMLVKPVTPAFEGLGESRRATPRWDRTLGRLVGGLSQLAGTDLASIERTDTLAGVLVEEARRMIPDTQVMLSLVPHQRQDRFGILAGAGPWAEALVGREWQRSGTVAGRSMQLRRPIETVRLEQLSALRQTLEQGGITTGRLVPLWTREPLPDGRDALGVLGWYRQERRFFSPFERRLMGEFCRLASLMLQRTELAAATARSVARLQAGVQAAHDMTRSLHPAEIVEALVDRGVDMTSADRAAVLRVEGGRMTTVAGRDNRAEPPTVGAVLPVDAMRTDDGVPLVRRAIETGAVARSAGYQVAGIRTGLEDHPVRHVVAVPVRVAGQPDLVLVFSRRRDEAFTEDDERMLEMVTGIAGLALRNAVLYVEVEEADRVKTDFLNMAAHELRTPLTVIRGYLSMMAENSFGELPAPWSGPVETLRDKCDELGRLVEELLLAARLETGRMSVDIRPVDLNELAREAVASVRGRSRAAGSTIRLEPARRPLVVAADAEYVLRILDALLANALAYTDEEPWIRVRVRPGADRAAEVEVEDRGRGIDQSLHDLVFERFVRATDDVKVAGAGLGLYIARELAARLGGRLTLEWSRPGQGSRFMLTLPELDGGRDD